MPHWRKPSEELPEVEAGDRVAIIVYEACPHSKAMQFRIVMLEATEDGWTSPDDTYGGYTPEDGVLWTTEKDLCGIAVYMKEIGEL